ncbi:hypothetical protein [Streptomyces profundus]|uniref:hypothetical protein n=1 Tax=Streptomyces profundus TaxID=2867410 RepID=UPI001D1651C4|nr:hypothetical protein [Streptomyces sp. MA3_2.13]UED83885.1 hypothetical protein K4G22_06380 [Streptomyces sp. MA3_2.13]
MSQGPEDEGPALPPPLALPDNLRAPQAGPEVAEVADYERYFGITRTSQGPDGWTRGLLATQAMVLADLPAARLADHERTALLTGLLLLNHLSLTAAAPDAAGAELPWQGPRGPAEPGAAALWRWRLGHQLFHLLLTAMNRELDRASAAAGSAGWPPLIAALKRLTVLYDAATATMSYAADFGPDTYREQVRPTMRPPFVSPGFSGVFNREHRELTTLMRALRRTLGELAAGGGLPAEVAEAADLVRGAQRRNRANHLRVCEACVPDGVSLLREHLDRADGGPAA